MAEALKRWNGSEWVTVAAVNRIEVSTEGGNSGVIFGIPAALANTVQGSFCNTPIFGAATKIE